MCVCVCVCVWQPVRLTVSRRAAELANSLDAPVDGIPLVSHSTHFIKEYTLFAFGKSLFDVREYRRAAHALRDAKSNEGFFLKCYSLFLVCVVMSVCLSVCVSVCQSV